MATHRYRSREITGEEILFIRKLLGDHPELSRWKLSRQLCEAGPRPNGVPAVLCRNRFDAPRAGEKFRAQRIVERQKPEPVIPDNVPCAGHWPLTPLESCKCAALGRGVVYSLMEKNTIGHNSRSGAPSICKS
jgi:hypothetical protein